ncbi:hypothetical protein GCM10010431_19790 [Streptomyces kunmingensis]
MSRTCAARDRGLRDDVRRKSDEGPGVRYKPLRAQPHRSGAVADPKAWARCVNMPSSCAVRYRQVKTVSVF